MSRRLLLVVLATFAAAMAAVDSSATLPEVRDPARLIGVVLQDEVWREGGPREERINDLLQRSVTAGDGHLLAELGAQLSLLIRRGLVRPEAVGWFATALSDVPVPPELGDVDLAAGLRTELALAELGASGRRELYRSIISTGRPDERHGLTWQVAALRALDEKMDVLIPVIEGAIATTSSGGEITERLTMVALPLARARQEADWGQAYIVALRKAEAEEIDPWQSPRLYSLRERLFEEALLEIVIAGREDLAGAVEKLLPQAQKAAHDTVLRREDCSLQTTETRCLLLRTMERLGHAAFQASSAKARHPRFKPRPEAEVAEEELVHAGSLAPRKVRH